MPFPTPFFDRTAPLCKSMRWKEWAGFYAVCAFDIPADREYFAFRHQCGLIDVSPLFKYDLRGPDAGALLDSILTRPVSTLKPGQIVYTPWCDDQGKVVDDGTVTRMGEDHFRLTAAIPNFSWLSRQVGSFRATVEDVSQAIAALSLQGPTSRLALSAALGENIEGLKFFFSKAASIDGVPVTVSRTGYTGDLGYEIWCAPDQALKVWDGLIHGGATYGLLPAALDAMDMTRIEAGFVLNGIDYTSAPHCPIEQRKSSPFELNLGWAVKLDRAPFLGQGALAKEKTLGSAKSFVGLEIGWDEFEAQFARYGLPPEVPAHAWRTAVPIYSDGGHYIGQATSGTWSPLLKKNLALATVDSVYAAEGTTVKFEITVEYQRQTVAAVVTKLPFYNPERKRS